MTLSDYIIKAKCQAGPDAFLWVHDSGDVILWPSKEESRGDSGLRAVGRWRVDPETLRAIDPAVDMYG